MLIVYKWAGNSENNIKIENILLVLFSEMKWKYVFKFEETSQLGLAYYSSDLKQICRRRMKKMMDPCQQETHSRLMSLIDVYV